MLEEEEGILMQDTTACEEKRRIAEMADTAIPTLQNLRTLRLVEKLTLGLDRRGSVGFFS